MGGSFCTRKYNIKAIIVVETFMIEVSPKKATIFYVRLLTRDLSSRHHTHLAAASTSPQYNSKIQPFDVFVNRLLCSLTVPWVSAWSGPVELATEMLLDQADRRSRH